jgi:tRNA-Thr(GGU) m(6)t(6)A37 methyltransferase TsaA
LLVLYWAHLVKPEARSLTRVHPMGRKDLPLVGVFSTCSPARPNPVLVIAVRLLERDGNILRVEGLDAVDGSPVLDIKPYLPSYYAITDVILSDWMNRILSEME